MPLRYLRRRGAIARRAGRRGRGGSSQLCCRLEIVGLAKDRDRGLTRRALPEIAAARRAARRGEVEAMALVTSRARRGPISSWFVQDDPFGHSPAAHRERRRDVAKLGRERALDLVVVEAPATPRGGRAPPRVGDAGGTRRIVSAESWPISVGTVPVIELELRSLRRRGAVARRAGRRGRGGNSQLLQRRELAELGRDRAGDLGAIDVPATPRVGRAPRRASGTRGELARSSAPRAGRSRSGSCLRSL